MLFWGLKLLIIGPLLRLLLRPTVTGAEHIPATGPVILAGNHLSFIDPIALAALARRRVRFLAASTYYVKRGAAGRFVGLFLTHTGMKPIDRSGGSASEASLRTGLEILSKGAVLGIYPEGSRTRDGRLHRGRTGVARLALLSGAPVVPVAMIGTAEVMPVHSHSVLPRIRRIEMRVGAPLLPERTSDLTDGAALRAFTDRIMRALQELGGQEYVDEYTNARRDR
ncbi:1-acyl-sn-glycerol-3-phosphate acyltransferase [Amnibacterium sp.]|uniref:lysophospholipid acyltransferase family protein n=1 Tax=Amnibacterium sp. TaxID=1872496 RepID=UPI002609F4F9|nr:lysophospholipid acyltransferase family protein [Amnibacterium sp.]MCU1475222.1 1-acyl-sn-glycerol-3-phosphate acyltransferase [Amnibacterium sp.]